MPDWERRRQWEMLVIAIAVIGLSLALDAPSGDRVALGVLPQWPLPPMCASRSLFGVECPGCGLTRSFVHLAHGRWSDSFRCHRVGWFLAVAVLLQLPYRGAAIYLGRLPLGRRLPTAFGTLLIALLLGNWLLGLLHP